MTHAEQIAEQIESVLADARRLGVNVFALVQGDTRGGAYFAGDVETILPLVEEVVATTKKKLVEGETSEMLNQMGISYGL